MSQPVLEGMPERLYAAAPSRLTTFLDCPRRYRLAYLDRPTPRRGPPWAHYAVGASVHAALARWWGLPRARRTPEAGGTLLVQGWLGDGFRDRAQRAEVRERTRAEVERYLAGIDPDVEPVAVERTVTIRTRRASLWGRLDRLDDRPGLGLVVVDYKTGRSRLTVEHAGGSLALAVYAAAAARTLRRECRRVELHHVPTGEVLAWDHTEASIEAALGQADDLAAQLRDLDDRHRAGLGAEQTDEAFPPRVGQQCGWCDFRAVCPEGRSQPAHAPWDAVTPNG